LNKKTPLRKKQKESSARI